MKTAFRSVGKFVIVTALAAVLLGGSALAAASSGAPSPAAGDLALPGASLGVVTIWANGTVSVPSAPITVAGTTYTLSANLNGELRDLASHVTLDGAGFDVNYTAGLTGGGNASVVVNNATGVVVENFRATNATRGIDLFNVTQSTVSTNALPKLEVGIMVQNSSGIGVYGNDVNFTVGRGVYALDSSVVNISHDWAVGNGTKATGFSIYTAYTSYVTAEDDQCNGTAAGIEAEDAHDVVFADDNVSNSLDGLGVDYAQNVLIDNNVAFNSSYGTWSEYGRNVTVSDNREVRDYNPLYDEYDDGANFTGNYAPFNGVRGGEGIYSEYSSNVVFASNDLANSFLDAAYVYGSAGVTLLDNNLTNATSNGIYAEETYGNLWIIGDQVAEPTNGNHTPYGFDSYESYGSTYIANSTFDHLPEAVYLYEVYGSTTLANDSITNASSYGVYSEYAYGPLTVTGSDLAGSYAAVEYAYSYSGGLTVTNDRMNGSEYGVYVDDDGYGHAPIYIANNTITNSTYAVDTYYQEGTSTIVNNDLTHAGEYAIELEYSDYQPTTIANNNVSDSTYTGIYVYEGLNVAVTDNTAHNDTYIAIDLEDSYGLTSVTGNQVQGSPDLGLYAYYEYGVTTIAGNNFTNSYDGLDLESLDNGVTVTGNDVSNSTYVYLYGSYLTQVAANNFLRDGLLSISYDTIGQFYHNDINSSSFAPLGNSITGSWNAPYPIGGNYWTGYVGTDSYSGPMQNVPGRDGIGDTPYSILGQTDAYPLMHPWANLVTTFTASGLPSGAAWSVTLNGATQSSVANGALVFAQPNGAYSPYSYSVAAPAGYTASPASGAGEWLGQDVSIALHFTVIGYLVSVNQTGLPSGTTWGVEFAGMWTNGSAASLTTVLANGTYTYSFAAVRGYDSPAGGSLTVQGRNVYLTAAYTPPAVTVTFIEVGLTAGQSWSVTLGTNPAQTSVSTTISFQTHAGTWSYSVTGPSGDTVTPSSGTISPLNGNVTVYVVVTSGSPATTSGSGGSAVSSDLFYGVVAGLVIALVLAAVGWAMYARRRPPPPSPPVAAAPSGVKAWDESSAAASAPPSATGAPPGPPPGAH